MVGAKNKKRGVCTWKRRKLVVVSDRGESFSERGGSRKWRRGERVRAFAVGLLGIGERGTIKGSRNGDVLTMRRGKR